MGSNVEKSNTEESPTFGRKTIDKSIAIGGIKSIND
jgi:hypothetical protein